MDSIVVTGHSLSFLSSWNMSVKFNVVWILLAVVFGSLQSSGGGEAASIGSGEPTPCMGGSNLPKEWFPPSVMVGVEDHGLLDYGPEPPPGWGACLKYSRATCCGVNQTSVVYRMVAAMDRAGMSRECQDMTERVLCAVGCDPDVGTGRIPPHVCVNECNDWFEACKDEFFSPTAGSVHKVPMPCSEHAVVCSKLGDVYSSGPRLCEAMALRWSDDAHACLAGTVNLTRRGSPVIAKPRRATDSSSSTSHLSLWEWFLKDMQRFSVIARRFSRKSTKTLKHWTGIEFDGITILAFGGLLMISVIFARLFFVRRLLRGNDDDF